MSLDDVLKSIQKKFGFQKKIEIDGISFDIAVLSYDEDMKAASIPEESTKDPLVYYNETRRQILSYSIRSINGEEIPEIVKIDDKVSKERGVYVKEFLAKVPPKVIDQLFEAYIDLRDEAEKKLNDSLKYDWYKTPEARDEERKKKREEEEAEKKKAEEEAKKKEEVSPGPVVVPAEDKPIVFKKIEEPPENEQPNG